MKRFHVHVAVKDLEQSVRFYSTMFGSSRLSGSPTTPSGCSTTRA